MKGAVLGGIVKGIPAGGAYWDVNLSEQSAITNAAASVARGLALGGAVALGAGLVWALGVMGKAAFKEQERQALNTPPPPSSKPSAHDIGELTKRLTVNPVGESLSSFSLVQSREREIFGICLDEWIDASCEGQRLSIPLAFIHELRFVKSVGGIVLIDGSRLANVKFVKPYLCFCTLAGLQTVELNHLHVRWDGAALTENDPHALSRDELDRRALKAIGGGIEDRDSYNYRQAVERIDFETRTQTRLIRGVLLDEAERVRERLLHFLRAEESAVKDVLGLERYQEYLDAALNKSQKPKPKLLSQGTASASVFPLPGFARQDKGVLEIVMRGCKDFVRDNFGYFTLGVSETEPSAFSRLLFEKGELDLNRGISLGSCIGHKLNLPRQDALSRGLLKREGSYVVFKLDDAHPCCIYKNGAPLILDSQVEKTGSVVFGKDDVLEIGEAYALRWHNYYG